MIAYHTFENGISPVWTAINEPDAVKALMLSLKIALIAVPLNTIFGDRVRADDRALEHPWQGVPRGALNIPFAVSPVVVGLTLILVYGQNGWFGKLVHRPRPSRSSSPCPGMVIATIFVSLPFVAREVIPVLREIGTDQEQAASTLGASCTPDLLAGNPPGHPLGRHLRRGADHRARDRRVRRGRRRQRQRDRAELRPCHCA